MYSFDYIIFMITNLLAIAYIDILENYVFLIS